MKSLSVIATILALSAPAHADEPVRSTIELREDAVIGGISVHKGTVEIFQPGGELAAGTLAGPAHITGLDLGEGVTVDFQEPGRLRTAKLPATSPAVTVAGVPFRGGAMLGFGYDEYLVRVAGKVARNPDQIPGFPTGGLNGQAFQNDVKANCMQALNHLDKPFRCTFSVLLSNPIDQQLGTQTIRIPGGARVGYMAGGISAIELAEDTTLLGLPVSSSEPIRLNNYSVGSPVGIMSLQLAADADYQGQPLAAGSQVEFYDADAYGISPLRSFVPRVNTIVKGGNQDVIVQAGRRAEINRDASLRYGILGTNQMVHGILFPATAILFLGDQLDSTVSSVGLQPFTKIVVDGVEYGNSIGGEMFVDFDEHEKVKRVR